MKTTDRVIELLYDRREGWWSIHELAGAAGVGPVPLDHALAELGRRGHQLECSPAMGIRLHRPPALDAHLIERNLGTRRIGRHVICFALVDSTSDTAADSARQARSDGLAVLAEGQRAGRGRHGRHWLSPTGANILLSVLLKDPTGALPAEAVTVMAGLAVAEGIEGAFEGDHQPRCTLKWPNDVVLTDRKVAGVLVERRRRAGKRIVVVGVGINVNACPPADDVRCPATSLAEHFGEELDRIPVVRAVLRRMDEWVGRLTGDAPSAANELRERWAGRCGMLNERHTIRIGRRQYTGRVVGIDPVEGLILLTDAGLHVRIPADGATVV